MTHTLSDTEQLEARLKSLVVIASLVLDDLNNSDTGWYYQFQREIQIATQVIKKKGIRNDPHTDTKNYI